MLGHSALSSSIMSVYLLFVLLVIPDNFISAAGAVIRESPVDTFTTPGSDLILRCSVNNQLDQPAYNVYWYRHNPSNAYLTKGTQVFHQMRTGTMWERLAVVGDSTAGEYFLQIRDVRMSDAGDYSCVYFQGDTYLGESIIATVTVYVPPDEGYPRCSLEPNGVYLEPGQRVVLTCVSSGGNPKPRLDWMSWHEILPGKVEQDPQPKATYELQLMETDNGAVFTCVEDTPATPQLRTCSLKPFHRPTNVSISTSPVNIGEDAVFSCIGVGVPMITNYTWTVAGLPSHEYVSASGEKVFIQNNNQILRIVNVRAKDNATSVKCFANNEINEEGSASAVVLVSQLLPSGKNMSPRSEGGPKDGAGISAGIIIGSMLFLILLLIGVVFLVRMVRLKMAASRGQDSETQVTESQPLRSDTKEATSPIVNNLQSNPRPVTICLTPRDAIVEHIRETEESGGQPIRPFDETGSRVTVVGRLSCAGMTHDVGDIGMMYSKPVKTSEQKQEQADIIPKQEPAHPKPKPRPKPKPALRPKPKLLPKPEISSPLKPAEEPAIEKDIIETDPIQPEDDGEVIYENTYRRPDITLDLGEEMEPYLQSKFSNWNGGQAELL